MMRLYLVGLAMLILVTGCAQAQPNAQRDTQDAAQVVVQASLTPSTVPPTTTPSPTVKPTSSATPSPTFTPTPTSTAIPVSVSGDPRVAAVHAPVPDDTSVCGLVDFFDFPLEAPFGNNGARGGTDFGIFRRRYDKYHAGEDWGIGGRSSLGAPVYSIGHGRVTYAEPLGWGRDQGVIIVRHYFTDGRVLLSFYGHLDPESFEVRAGDCVARGDMIAKIGKPKTRPHLHFEVREHMPLETATGYWWEDPTVVGWKPPSATVWNSRMSASPGVLWSQPFIYEGMKTIAILEESRFLVREGDDIVALDMTNGETRWQVTVGEEIEQVQFNSDDGHIYTASQLGEIAAFALPQEADGTNVGELLQLWQIDLDVVGIPQLFPLPGGGLLFSSWGELVAVSEDGVLLWEADLESRPFDWLASGDTLLFSQITGLWSASANGLQHWDAEIGGHLAASGANVLLYDGSTLYRLGLDDQSAEPLFAQPGGTLQTGAVTALPDGGAVITHADPADRRLIAFDAAGHMLWERSVAEYRGNMRLFADGDQPFLVLENSGDSGSEVSIFAIGLEDARLTHLFSGGTRNSPVDETKLFYVGDGQILINIDGRSLTVMDSREAQQIVSKLSSTAADNSFAD